MINDMRANSHLDVLRARANSLFVRLLWHGDDDLWAWTMWTIHCRGYQVYLWGQPSQQTELILKTLWEIRPLKHS